jgi:hypothetical protein
VIYEHTAEPERADRHSLRRRLNHRQHFTDGRTPQYYSTVARAKEPSTAVGERLLALRGAK